MDPREPTEKRRQTEKDVTGPPAPEKERIDPGSGAALEQEGEGVPKTPEIGPATEDEPEVERRPGQPDEEVRR